MLEKTEMLRNLKNIYMLIRKVWTAMDLLSIIWKYDRSDEIKRDFFQAVAVSVLLYGCSTWTQMKRLEEKTRWELHQNAGCSFGQILENNRCTTTYLPSHKPSK